MEQSVNKKSVIRLGVVLVLTAGLALALYFLPKQRITLKQKAAIGTISVQLENVPATTTPKNVSVNDVFDVKLKILAGSFKISGVDIKLDVDNTKLQFVSFIPTAGKFSDNLMEGKPDWTGQSSGQMRVVLVNTGPTANLATGTFEVGTIKLKAIGGTGGQQTNLMINKALSQIVGTASPTPNDVDFTISGDTVGSKLTYIVAGTVAPTNPPVPTNTITPPGECITCPAGKPAHNLGNAICDEAIDLGDLQRWIGEITGAISTKTANFNCGTTEQGSDTVDMGDFQRWLNNYRLANP